VQGAEKFSLNAASGMFLSNRFLLLAANGLASSIPEIWILSAHRPLVFRGSRRLYPGIHRPGEASRLALALLRMLKEFMAVLQTNNKLLRLAWCAAGFISRCET
jgi:hypothetical protein